MGLDASVMCNCFRAGKTAPPPFPADWLEVDAEGRLDLKEEHRSNENWINLYVWEQSCCNHKGMDFASERISNWGGYRMFQSALEVIGWDHFPVLKEELPETNGGLMQPSACVKALAELDFFISKGSIGKNAVLVDSTTGDVLFEYIPAYRGLFILSGSRGINVGLSEFEFFAVDSKTGEDLFRATRIRQITDDGSEITGNDERVVWENLDTGTVYRSGIAISGKQISWEDGTWQKPDGRCRFARPSQFHVEQRHRSTQEFDNIVRALRTVFTASVETGNPVRWC